MGNPSQVLSNRRDNPNIDYSKEIVFRRVAIRRFCLDCTGYQHMEVKECVSFNCPLWPYRMGTESRVVENEEAYNDFLCRAAKKSGFEVKFDQSSSQVHLPPKRGWKIDSSQINPALAGEDEQKI